jgi:hypothetical protein
MIVILCLYIIIRIQIYVAHVAWTVSIGHLMWPFNCRIHGI